jgi:hypothetical protein
MRSRMFMPFFIARIGSLLKYAVRCSNSVKSSTDRRLRFEPWICWWKTPRRLVVSSRKRRCRGRTSGVRWNCPVVWPFTWPSKQVTPQTGLRRLPVVGRIELLLREGRDEHPEPVELDRRQDVLEQPVKVVDRDHLAARHVAQLRPILEEDAGGNSGRKASGKSNSTSNRSSRGNIAICICGNTCPPVACLGWGSPGYGKTLRLRMSSGLSPASRSHVSPEAKRAVGPTGSGLPRDIFGAGSSRGVRS